MHRLTGATDIVIATFTPGRAGQLFEDTVGPLFNFLPLRTDHEDTIASISGVSVSDTRVADAAR